MIKEKLHNILGSLPTDCRLVAVSKYHPAEMILACYDEGQRIFGESHEQEIRQKHEMLPKDIEWHFIGHLQTNKVKYIAPYIDMVEACDSVKLMREIEKQAAKNDRIIKVLLELHIAEETSKYGFQLDECRKFLAEGEWHDMSHVRICGLMMMASNTEDEEQIRREFTAAADFFDEIKAGYFADDDNFRERSWGMSSDFKIALQCRSTMVRIGTYIFGERQY
ncbi:MAG: YggS family pyridoxal phosphate-dependent enzyme [Bacteroidales bacterium]|nr:YggS family pyridoxal phosphate-dependent enzyme [Bacteroidales bacterium]MCM1148135.1 YggS family pyridoxal phosphate-dependent enzyme [Bacteroidales bacterium]MCM1206551.1 YggS family pyridoxal phosphate-dependent enzyme [Bacillota bacterium]MCM1510547.1 YggS family pyridoxal phosphate-dependent enzyme [Clostridium sp.]